MVLAICPGANSNLWIGTETGLSSLGWKALPEFHHPRGPFPQPHQCPLRRPRPDAVDWHPGRRAQPLQGRATLPPSPPSRGLFSDEVYEILEDDYGYFWMSCRNGLFRVARKELEEFRARDQSALTCTAFGRADGLLTSQFNGVAKPAGWKSQDGRLWFATIRGVVSRECRIKTNERPPPVVIEEVSLTGALPVPCFGARRARCTSWNPAGPRRTGIPLHGPELSGPGEEPLQIPAGRRGPRLG